MRGKLHFFMRLEVPLRGEEVDYFSSLIEQRRVERLFSSMARDPCILFNVF